MKKLLLAGGGTGGHVLAGVAVADAWADASKEQNAQAQILFVGAHGGMEEKLVPRAGYPLQLLHLGSLNRVSLSRKLKTYLQLPLSLLKSVWILLRFRPHVVLGVGGYASGPVVLIAKFLSRFGLLKTRVAILEQNSIPGYTNRILGSRVDQVFAAFPGTENRFPAGKVQVTGNPIRSSMTPLPPASRNPLTLFIFGGSQGALGVNTLVLAALPHLKDLNDRVRWIHQTGEKDFERVRAGYLEAGVEARVEKFIYDMPAAYQEASLLICRSGSSTLSEVAAVGRAAILIPLPSAADNHQFENAQIFAKAGAAFLVDQTQASGAQLAELIRRLVQDPSELTEKEQAVKQFFRPHAAKDIVSRLI